VNTRRLEKLTRMMFLVLGICLFIFWFTKGEIPRWLDPLWLIAITVSSFGAAVLGLYLLLNKK